MPLYEYQCSRCGSITEVIQKFSDASLTTCPDCSGKLHKLISKSSFHLKGTGWYVTDYNSQNGNGNGSGNGSEGKSKEDKTKDKMKKSKSNKKEPSCVCNKPKPEIHKAAAA
jgi:putative FmdB family regulatory protein